MISIFVAAAVLFAVIYFAAGNGSFCEVVINGEVTKKLPLDEDTTHEIITDAGRNIVSIQGGKVTMQEADCPDLICVHHSAISKEGQSIICLPHRVVLRIVGEESSIDAYMK